MDGKNGLDIAGLVAYPVKAYARFSIDNDSAHLVVPGASPQDSATELRAFAQLDALPTLLNVLCNTAGLRVAGVTRSIDNRWVVCAVKDDIDFGLQAGDEFAVHSLLCGSQATLPIVIEHASVTLKSRYRRLPQLYGIESYVSVPIVMPSGHCFGNLFALDRAPALLSDPRILAMFQQFAALIAQQLDRELSLEQQKAVLRDERTTSELREQFIAILGHDLRNPLQAIYATSDLLVRRLDDFVGKNMAERVKTNSLRMSALIDDALDFARGRLGGGIGVDMSDAEDLAGNLQAVVRELQDAQPDREIFTDFHVVGKVHCDIRRVQQMASNLVANALVHGSVNGVVRVCATSDAEWFTFSVWNDGDPIPVVNIDKIFEPFWRHSISANRQGLGLGLYICAQIVRAHAGKLTVTSTGESGTNFIARLPMRSLQKATDLVFKPTLAN